MCYHNNKFMKVSILTEESDMDELLQDFVMESKEHLASIEDDFLRMGQLKDNPDSELANKVFRAIHTIKGVAGFVGQVKVGELSHIMESILEKIKSEEMKAETPVINALLKGVDYLNEMLDSPETSNDIDITEPLAELGTFLNVQAASDAHTEEQSAPNSDTFSSKDLASQSTDVYSSKNIVSSSFNDIPEIQITPEMREKFVEESLDLLDVSEETLLKMEHGDDSEEAVHEAFRAIHSFKGNCGFFGLEEFEKISHKVENKLECLLERTLLPEKHLITLILDIVDLLRNELAKYQQTGIPEAIPGVSGILDLLDEIKAEEPKTVTTKVAEVVEHKKQEDEVKTVLKEKKPQPKVEEKVGEKVEKVKEAKKPAKAKSVKAIRQDIRVDLAKLDTLINLVGELVIAEAMVVRNPAIFDLEDENLERAIHHLNRISSDLQDIAMSVRMVPLATTFRKMTRLVYDLSNKAGKKVDLELIGEETEVDKTVIESIGDPLVHIIRNAVDHGLESPEDRVQNNKPETGHVTIQASHEGGEVLIIIKDDGRGLRRDKILNKALERGLISEDGIDDMVDEEVFSLIFEPGFSTADQITDISGRGVGMDVVKKNIEKLKGRIEVKSAEGLGTTFILHIPLTLAIIDGMLIKVGDASYTIPLLSIRESLRPTEDMITVTPSGQEILRVREEMIPVLRLHNIYNVKPKCDSLIDGLVVIVESGLDVVALLVDELLGQQQTVVKPLSSYLSGAKAVSGCTILGTGEVSLILDIPSLISVKDEF